jgi:hypothetical protein
MTLLERACEYLENCGFIVGRLTRGADTVSIERDGYRCWISPRETIYEPEAVGTDFSFTLGIIIRTAVQDHRKIEGDELA